MTLPTTSTTPGSPSSIRSAATCYTGFIPSLRGVSDDSQAAGRALSLVLTQARSEDRPSPQPGDVQEPRGGREARTRGAIFQARLSAPCARERLVDLNGTAGSQAAAGTCGTARPRDADCRSPRRPDHVRHRAA